MTLENKLIDALKSCDHYKIDTVFEEIYYAYSKLVYFIISQYVLNQSDIEELTQDVFVNFFNNLNKTTINNIKYYLVRSAKNKALNFLKAKKENFELDDNVIYEYAYTENSNLKYVEIIDQMKKYLTDIEIDIIIKRVIYDISFKELASIYKKPINSILSIYHRAIKKFKERNK